MISPFPVRNHYRSNIYIVKHKLPEKQKRPVPFFRHAQRSSRPGMGNKIHNHGRNHFRMGTPESLLHLFRQIISSEESTAFRIIKIVAQVSYAVCIFYQPAFHSSGRFCAGMVQNTISYLPGQVQSFPILFQMFHNPHALFIMPEMTACII